MWLVMKLIMPSLFSPNPQHQNPIYDHAQAAAKAAKQGKGALSLGVGVREFREWLAAQGCTSVEQAGALVRCAGHAHRGCCTHTAPSLPSSP